MKKTKREKSPSPSPVKSLVGWRPSFRLYLILMNVVLLCLLFPSIALLLLHREASFRDSQLERNIVQMRRSLEIRSASLSRSLAISAEEAIAGYDFSFLNNMLNQVASNDPELRYSMVMGFDRKVLVHSNPKRLGIILDDPLTHRAVSLFGRDFPLILADKQHVEHVRYHEGIGFFDEGTDTILETVTPIYNGIRLFGVLRCGYSLAGLENEITTAKNVWAIEQKRLKISLLSLTAVFFSVGVVVAVLFTRSLVRAIDVLNIGVKRVAKGDLEHEIQYQGMVCKELIGLSQDMNMMTYRLRTSYQQLDEYSRSLEEKVDERTHELREAQSHLMEQAHEAGMAEMAVGILHNIGNAMTPAKISTIYLMKRLRESPLRSHLGKKIPLVYSVVDQDSTLNSLEKKNLLRFIELLPQSIREEYDQAIDELGRIQSKHDHIESIISLQMRYARLLGNRVEVDLNRLIDDSLVILGEALVKRSIRVIKMYEDLPAIRIEEAKMVQIIINLIKNAYEAMDELEPSDRRLMLSTSVEKGNPDQVVLSVKDCGIGFTEEEKGSLFQFGYSSKSRGSGFGLHSCANYLIANKCSITAQSKGENMGAEFVVRIPVSASEKDAET
ncbi:MAG: GHKL domain-containing protein [Proteobacteria bacterium]|nr:GHKL domain-containing protein [Pseudomonadota bacterium]